MTFLPELSSRARAKDGRIGSYCLSRITIWTVVMLLLLLLWLLLLLLLLLFRGSDGGGGVELSRVANGRVKFWVSAQCVPEIVAVLETTEPSHPTGKVLQREIPQAQMLAKIHVLEKGTCEIVALENGNFDESLGIGKAERKGDLFRRRHIDQQRFHSL